MEVKRRFSRLRLAYVLVFFVCFAAWIIAQFGDDRNWIVATAGAGITGTLWPLVLIAAVLLATSKEVARPRSLLRPSFTTPDHFGTAQTSDYAGTGQERVSNWNP